MQKKNNSIGIYLENCDRFSSQIQNEYLRRNHYSRVLNQGRDPRRRTNAECDP